MGRRRAEDYGITTALLISVGYQKDAHIRLWVIALASTAVSLGTLSGGWRIVKNHGLEAYGTQAM